MGKRAEVLDAWSCSSVENTSYYQKCIFQGGGHTRSYVRVCSVWMIQRRWASVLKITSEM